MLTQDSTTPLKIMLADDSSQDARVATMLVRDLPLPPKSTLTVLGILSPREADEYAVREAGLEQTKALLKEKGFQVTAELLGGHPVEAIIEYADEHNPDLVVLGAKGRRAVLGISLGGVAQQVVEYGHWPVLIVRGPYAGLQKVLVVTDGSPYSQRAVEFLARFPLPASAEVQVVHILPPILQPGLIRGEVGAEKQLVTDQEKPDWQIEEECEGQDILDRAVRALKSASKESSSLLLRGDAATEILETIRANDIHLVVAGSRGLTPVTNWLLGSVARKLAHYSGCSTLIVRGGAHRN